jgi:DNA repair protein RecO (recombination protein O)
MKQIVTTGIILSRTNYAEADRILTILTPDQGKIRAIARGVRKVKSKLAGGIELFSVSSISFIRGKSELYTLTSTRLIKHYGRIVENLERTKLAYELVKLLNKVTEDEPGPEYFELLEQSFEALDEPKINPKLIECWFAMRLLGLGGHAPNLKTDSLGQALDAKQKYNFDLEKMAFVPAPAGRFNANHIKFLRLGFSNHQPKILQQVSGLEKLVGEVSPVVHTMLNSQISI